MRSAAVSDCGRVQFPFLFNRELSDTQLDELQIKISVRNAGRWVLQCCPGRHGPISLQLTSEKKHMGAHRFNWATWATACLLLTTTRSVSADLAIANGTSETLDVEYRIDCGSPACTEEVPPAGCPRYGYAEVSVDPSASIHRLNYYWFRLAPGEAKVVWCGDATGKKIFAGAVRPNGRTIPDMYNPDLFDDPDWNENKWAVPLAGDIALGQYAKCSAYNDIYCYDRTAGANGQKFLPGGQWGPCVDVLHYSGIANQKDVGVEFKNCDYPHLHSPNWFRDPDNLECLPSMDPYRLIELLNAFTPPGSKIDWCASGAGT